MLPATPGAVIVMALTLSMASLSLISHHKSNWSYWQSGSEICHLPALLYTITKIIIRNMYEQ